MNFIVDNWYLIVMAIGSGAMLLVPMIKGGGMGGLSAAAAVQLAEGVKAKGIVVITRRGLMADLVANCRPFATNIYAFTNMSQPRRTMMLNRGVLPFKIDFSSDPEKTLQTAFRILKDREDFKVGDKVVIISDVLAQQRVDSIQIRDVPSDDILSDLSAVSH